MPIVPSSTYKPPYFLFNKHLQTIIPSLFRKVENVHYQRSKLITPDNDFLDLDWLKGGNKKLAVLSHGLEGDSNRPYIKGLAQALHKNGYDVLAWNFRGCGGEINSVLKFYHSGATEDLDYVIEEALQGNAYDELFLGGFSLGGNLTLKYIGEHAQNLRKEIKKAVVFSVPLNLHSSCLEISKSSNFIYSKRFLNRLKNKIKAKNLLLPNEINLKAFKMIKNLKDFDDHYTAPLHGFRDALDYYSACSSIHFLEDIKIPTLIVNAKNDPFLPEDCFPEELLKNHPYVFFEAPSEGGHCGFCSNSTDGMYWSEKRAVEFLGE